ncbi:MAG: UDP-N-acetylmuramoylalanine--D-glutamate ligase [Nitrospirae bacterium GWC2_46_6]|nr:MAG: UDP-N-acetylmuramoylalanine--D-glutamate ligase [Nitrospirae bacterium GWC2_46_6]OGW20906.1 MAG: UDP-N-acetylmuramoylalanine--D-glutamate ligase [Nitrospirae bacterium GWA2_46_11]OGW23780.1 MAG: UDP-N-acetylmuramoylalanine--D-glutamate ligase [Nitrospirae bacterium GWB2_47_37]HAK89377.1 UDP-N-acetylmuramoyl-L-alanine--D-glutamate ligase [Nitrospiraceae bacterium]HCL81020.1 UDP-N-acetylmuramoyl-L-alanine--D-glutamate ligase [Nitrospiraceae bacterium]
MRVNGKKVTIVGLARSGVGAANLLSELGASVIVTDKKSRQELEPFLGKLNPAVKTVIGSHPPELFEDTDLIVISPGVPLSSAPLRAALEKGVKVIGELELAYQIVGNRQSAAGERKTEFLAITGTNGKSTVTALLYEIVRNSGFNAVVGGNIGNALTEEISDLKFQISNLDYIVAEVSSFQLETIDSFRPKGATILNITPDHLDRYASMQEYINAKCRMFLNQGTDDFLVLNADDPMTGEILKIGGRQWATGNRPEIFYFSRRKEVKGACYKDGLIHFSIARSLSPIAFTVDPSAFKIKGVHNIENAMAASLIALLSGCGADAVARTLKTFPGLEHRLEFVRELNGVKFINDSKGTNVGAVIKSIESFDEPVILIAGGRDKDGDFSALRPLVKDKVKAVILIGEAKDKIKKAIGDITGIFVEDSLDAAVARGKDIASAGDVVMLSPACASFDMFKDFEDRGRQFKKAVMEL